MELQPVILSGGSGTRLWPLSREQYPKQLLALVGEETMLQATAGRLAGFGGRLPVAQAHVCRAVCRRAERELVLLSHDPQAALSDAALPYLNRLSDLLFVMARAANHRAGVPEQIW